MDLVNTYVHLTSCSTFLAEKLVIAHLDKEFRALYQIYSFTAHFTKAHYWQISLDRITLSESHTISRRSVHKYHLMPMTLSDHFVTHFSNKLYVRV
jgi:endonuclease/exonuclease/phosphatase family metal-dependent hydrolase